MKFNSWMAICFFIGYFALGEVNIAILERQIFPIVHAIIGVGLTIAIGEMFGRRK